MKRSRARSETAILFEKELKERFNGFSKRKIDVTGLLIKLALIACLMVVFVIFFSKFIKFYIGIELNGVADVSARESELLTVIYSVILLVVFISSLLNIERALFDRTTLTLYSAMPIKPSSLLLSKMLSLLLREAELAFVLFLPVCLTFWYSAPTKAVVFLGYSAVMWLLSAPFSLAAASLFVLPYHYVKNFFKNRYILTFIGVTVLAMGLLIVYMGVLHGIESLLVGSGLKYLFDEKLMRVVIALTRCLYPARLFAMLTLNINSVFALCVIVASSAALFGVGVLVTKLLFNNAMLRKISENARFVNIVKPTFKPRSQVAALMYKEFNCVLRTPSYAFSCFSVALLMPLMLYACLDIGASMLSSLILVDCSFELAIFLSIIFNVLINTFCSTNVSREGSLFVIQKTMPISGKKLLFSKILFCMIIAGISNLLAAVTLMATSALSVGRGFALFGISLLFAFAQTCFSTRRDLERPTFAGRSEAELKESTATLSAALLLGLLIALATGGGALYLHVYGVLKMGLETSLATYIIAACAAILCVLLTLLYLLHKLEKRYYEFSEGV